MDSKLAIELEQEIIKFYYSYKKEYSQANEQLQADRVHYYKREFTTYLGILATPNLFERNAEIRKLYERKLKHRMSQK